MAELKGGPSISDSWERGSPYEAYIGRWSRKAAPAFLDWLAPAQGLSWLDVGCGSGALSAAIIDRCAPAHVTGIEPSEGFLELARKNLSGRAALHAGNAAAIPLDDGEVDVVVSGLVLNFVPDLRGALAEMSRVARPGAVVAAYVWDYADGMELIRHFWDAAVELDAAAAGLHEGSRFPVCRPDALHDAFVAAGFSGVQTAALDLRAEFAGFDDYWQPFLGGQGPAPAYAMSLDGDRRALLRESVRRRLPGGGTGRFELAARAWAVRGTTPETRT